MTSLRANLLTYIAAVVSLLIVVTWCVVVLLGRSIPSELHNALWVVLGFVFGIAQPMIKPVP